MCVVVLINLVYYCTILSFYLYTFYTSFLCVFVETAYIKNVWIQKNITLYYALYGSSYVCKCVVRHKTM